MRALFLSALVSVGALGASVTGARASCEEIHAHRELRVFKDPQLFRPLLQRFLEDEKEGWFRLSQESPLRGTWKGKVRFQRLGPAQEFDQFSALARLYELAEGQPLVTAKQAAVRIVPIQLCDEGGLGFVLESELAEVQKEPKGAGPGRLPPSVYPNPIPRMTNPLK